MNTFKTFLLAGAALTVLPAAALAADMPMAPVEEAMVAAASPWDAYVSAGAGYTFFDVGDNLGLEDAGLDDFDDFQAEVRTSASYQFASFGVQADMVFNYQSLDLPEVGGFTILDSVKTTDIAGHVFWRNDGFLIGAFGQYGLTSADLFESVGLDVDRVYAGAEAQAYWGNFTLYAQAGYQSADLGFGGLGAGLDEVDGFFVNAEARYFVTDNWKAFLKGGYNTASLDVEALDFELDFDTFTVGGGTEYRFDNSPISVFANAEYINSETDGLTDFGLAEEGEFDSVKVMAGLKLNLGTQTLIERDRSGASLDPVKDTLFNNIGAGLSGLVGGVPVLAQ